MNIVQFRNVAGDQRGIASLLSVVFFILIASIIMVGFTRMALLEGRQSLEDSLSKAAISAAYSGVNDAKRALLYCNQFPVRPAECNSLNNQTCPGFSNNPNLRSQLGLNHDVATNSIRVGDPTLNERYTCTIVTEDTLSVKGSLVEGSTDEATTLIPLRATGAFNEIVLSWQTRLDNISTLTGLDYGGDAVNNSYRDSSSFSAYFQSNSNWPALLGAHLMVQSGATIGYNGDGTVNGLDQRRWLFYPFQGPSANSLVGVGASNETRRELVQCNATTGYRPVTEDGSYVCQVRITGLNAVQGARYLQLTSLYRTTDYVVEILQNGIPVTFDNVNPQIDSTGAVDNVFRRVQVGVVPTGVNSGGRNPILPNAIDTGSGLCKNFTIDNVNFTEECN